MLLLYQISIEAVAISGFILLVLFSMISSRNEVESQRQTEKDLIEAENKRLELELQIREKELEREKLQTRRSHQKSIRLVMSTLLTFGIWYVTHDLRVAAGIGLLLHTLISGGDSEG